MTNNISLPVVYVSQIKPDANTGEKSTAFLRENLAKMMSSNRGVLKRTQINKLLDNLRKYYKVPVGADDSAQVVSISTKYIRTGKFENARILKFDQLHEAGLSFAPWDKLSILEKRAADTNNIRGRLFISQLKENLKSLFQDQGFKFERNTIKSMTLQLKRAAKDDTVNPAVLFEYADVYDGFCASYKTPENHNNVLITITRDSNETLTNIKTSAFAARVNAL